MSDQENARLRRIQEKMLPMTAHPVTINPDPLSVAYIERQVARIKRLRDIDTDEARAEIAKCEENLSVSQRRWIGRIRVAQARLKYKG
jgi:hypothetical protein